ncbi:sensor histidine kinase [Cohnella rhizosphaerae]|uniref:Sensor histidine kinase n=1 Tax=Cohnella rhizosphaerae TaxID=1457232 RepID=A0A9X4QT25_9BACL|nr:sensor histidine kinase [Cohnella rhizosphaerae]MDG0810671.1 sensor histidine kinase [Cohnella rhizosphaerae]
MGMRWIRKRSFSLNNVRLRNKMLIVYFLSVFVPVVLTNVIFYNITTNNVKKQKMRDISLAIEQIRNDFMTQVNVAVGISAVIYNDALLIEYMDKNYDVPSDYVYNYQTYIISMLNKYSPVYESIQRITLYSDNDTLIYGGQVERVTASTSEQPWYRLVRDSALSAPIVLRTASDYPGATGDMLSVVRKIGNAEAAEPWEKYMKIDLHPEAIREIFHNVTLEGDLYLLQGDAIQYSTKAGFDLAQTAGTAASPASRDTIVIDEDFGDVPYLSDWRIAGVFKESAVLEEVRKSKNFVLYLAIPNVLLPTLIIIWFSRSLNARLVRILKHMKKVKNHSFEIIARQDAEDEIGQLTAEFNRMTLQIKRLIHDVYIADIQKKELLIKRNQSQLHALQSQINPHFLFNSLETIRMRSLMKKEEETARIIHSMAKIFRKSLAWGKDWVTIRDELDLVACFLDIQKYRFGDKLDYRIEADESVLGLMIPKMTLQPLVENASIHGIEKLKEGGLIRVAVVKTAEGLVCTVSDNGAGIPPDRLASILSELERGEDIGESVGIKNVYYRLKLYYKENVGFEISSKEGEGTTFRICVKAGIGQDAIGGGVG